MDYKEATEYLFRQLPMFSRIGAPAYKPGLETSHALDEFFNHPHKKFKSIHVGGTNGKGSTSHIIASVLQAQGYKVGLYTSPHLVDFRERMRINGKMIPQEDVIEFVTKWKESGYEGQPSFFELTMMMAFSWFAQKSVDYAVIEVGMGGRLDSTNIITPLLSVITNISHDHNQFLGDTLSSIATEKAGIIKRGVPVVIGEHQEETDPVFIEKASLTGAPICFAEDTVTPIIKPTIENGWEVISDSLEFNFPLGGDYQKKNIITALSAIRKLQQHGIDISDEAIKTGFEQIVSLTGLMGRWTIIGTNPLTIADTGHNTAGLGYNIKQLDGMMSMRPTAMLRIVIGFVADKAIDKILPMLPRTAIYYVTNASIPRAMKADELYRKFIDAGFSASPFPDVNSAYDMAKKESSANDIIFVGGSTFIVADLLTRFS
ncbi:MAG: bifunctional folylpolyglutamate synthase/dihydrofolate synthase [Muribaculaceae bacterium]|nr:bifunctional folylpolyglutamate synthase/dihydrofolate synthase [Muribaculaceae bacterium]